jgi:hypothetical protein
MASKSKGKKSIFPLKLQIPLAILLGIVFILMLNAKLKGRRTAQGEPDNAVTAQVASTDSEHRVDELLDMISKEKPKSERERGPLPDLPGDPFAKPKRPPKTILPGDPEHLNGTQEDDAFGGQSREGFVGSLTLRATLIDGDKKFVLINDTLYGENDTIGAFKIVEIRERSATLKDDRGPVLLEMKGDDLS